MFQKQDIRLRKVEPQDLPFLYIVENDDTAWRDSSTHNPLSQKDLRDYIEQSTGDIFRDGQLRLIIEQPTANDERLIAKGEQRTMGVCDLFDFDPLSRKAAIGLYILPEMRGQHIAQRVVELLEEYAFSFLHLQQLYAIIAVDNTSCVRLFERMNYLSSARLLRWAGEHDAIVFQKLNETI